MRRKRKRKRVEPTGKPATKSSHRTIKCSLKSIVRDETISPRIEELVLHCNAIVIETYQFIRLFCLTKYARRDALPQLDEKFILYCLKAMGKRDNRGRKAQNESMQTELDTFYISEFKPLLAHDDKFELRNYTFLLPYLATQMHTAIHNNLKEHFVTRLLRFINKTARVHEQDLDKIDARKARRELKNAVFKNDASLVPARYSAWYEEHRRHIAPSDWAVSLPYDAKANPERYLACSFYMNSVLERMECKLFQPLSLRTSIVPHYITIDTASLISFFADKGTKGALLRCVRYNRERFWNTLFNLDKRVFRQKEYDFNYTLQTDGVAVSLLFVHKNYSGTKNCPNCITEERPTPRSIETYNRDDCQALKGRTVVGVDPGKFNIVYMSDGKKKLRYTAYQRRTETMTKRNQRILQTEKKRHDIIERETVLSDHNSKTVDVDAFKEYGRAKNTLNAALCEFYGLVVHRKMKWRHFVYTQRSEDRFIVRMRRLYGADALVAYGDWSRTTQMRHFVPTKGVGMRRLISRHFETVSINEFRTSKLCCNCKKELSYVKIGQEGSKKKLFRCLVCEECERSKSKKRVFLTRDLNAALNIRRLACDWIRGQTRPVAFCRNATGLPTTAVSQTNT